jgi:hypothetical protein
VTDLGLLHCLLHADAIAAAVAERAKNIPDLTLYRELITYILIVTLLRRTLASSIASFMPTQFRPPSPKGAHCGISTALTPRNLRKASRHEDVR